MKLAKLRVTVCAAISSLLLSMLAVPAQAASDGIVLDSGHTDAFYIDSDGGKLSVQVNHGLNNTKYDPNSVQFNISPLAYGDYSDDMPFLTKGAVGYYTNSWDLKEYFEPGWSAPSYRENGFKTLRVDFTGVRGPGAVSINGNGLIEGDPLGTFLIPTNKIGTLEKFVNDLENEETSKATRDLYTVKGIPDGTYYVEPGVSLPIFGHQHAHWFFTKAGKYQLTGKAVGKTFDGKTVESAPFTSTFVIAKSDEDGNPGETPDASGEETNDAQGDSASSDEPSSQDATADTDEADDDEDEESDQSSQPKVPQPSDSGILNTPITLDYGHTDGFFVLTNGDKPRLIVRENATSYEGTLRTPESVNFHLSSDFYEEIGSMNGTFKEKAGYHTNRKGKGITSFSPGWSVDNFEGHGYDKVAVKFLSVKGPGQIVLSGTPTMNFSLNPVLSTGSAYLSAGAKLPITGHTHGLWIFTAPGEYEYTAQVVATKTDGTTVTSDPVKYHWTIDANEDDPQTNKNPIDSTVSTDEETDSDVDEEESYDDADLSITSNTQIQAGQSLTVKGTGLPVSSKVSLLITDAQGKKAANPTDVSTSSEGTIAATIAVPQGLKPGKYFLGVTLLGSSDQLVNDSFTVIAGDNHPILPGEEHNPGVDVPPANPTPDSSLGDVVKTHEKVALDHGHLDLFTVIHKNGKLHLVTKDDSTNEEIVRDPADITLRVRNNTLTTLPDQLDNSIPKYGYYLDASGSSQQEQLFPGWDTYQVGPQYKATDIVVKKVSGPGDVYLFNFKRLGGIEPAFTSGKYKMENGSIIRQEHPSHVHTNWLFTQPGLYTMEVQAKTTPASGKGKSLESNVATFTWMVGDTDTIPEDNTNPNNTPAKPEQSGPHLGLASGKFTATENEKITVQASGLVPGSKVDFYLHSTPQLLAGDVLVNMYGIAQTTITTPKEVGLHTLIVQGKDGHQLAVMPFEITSQYPQGVIPDAGAFQPLDGKKPSSKRIEISNGHIDLFTVLANNKKISVKAKDDSHGGVQLHDPADVYWRVGDNAFTDIPDSMPKELSRKGYYLDQSGNSQDKMLFPGWDTNGVKPDFGATDIIFTKVKGPQNGKVFLFSNGRTGGVIPTLEGKNYELTDGSLIHQQDPAHVHTNWLFSAPGIYEMEVKAVATPVNGGTKVESEPVTYIWLVGDKTTAPTQTKTDDNPGGNNGGKDSGSENADDNGTRLEDNNGSQGGNSAGGGSGQGTPAPKCFPKQQGGNGKETILPQIKDDRTAPGKWIDPSSASFTIGAAGKATTNQAIGSIASGSPVWMISATQTANVPWVGANTQNPSFLEKTKGSATFTLTSFSGPGKMEVFTSGNFGKVVGEKWFTGHGNSGSGSVSLKPNSHVHPNWVFDKPGTYKVGITMSAQGKDGKKLSGTTTLTFNVGSGSGITEGHFDLGPTVGASGSKTVWLDENGNPCTPNAADLAATGAEGTLPVSLISLMLVLGGIGAVTYRRKYSAR
ncbi:choice-of-anchor M domain-containing protein [Arcanobacterium phocae]|uniref:choice-of-anchor M domain-containing protein n=1 Tax=Arcanobacterium phocae TaxID=131112 RepID=UPI001C0F355D|nr:choice-of-anchor M domain-containing protein [Arcanobacterium phocae]